MNIRCVTTGQTADGKSVFVSDTQVEPITVSLLSGAEFHRLWGSDKIPKLPTAGTAAVPSMYFPPAGGARFGFFTLPPEPASLPDDYDYGAGFAEFAARLPGLAEVMEPDHPGMHTTDTVDIDVVISGEIWLELDDGQEVQLRAGDCVIQNGTRHAWHNRSSEPCVIFVTLVGAERAG